MNTYITYRRGNLEVTKHIFPPIISLVWPLQNSGTSQMKNIAIHYLRGKFLKIIILSNSKQYFRCHGMLYQRLSFETFPSFQFSIKANSYRGVHRNCHNLVYKSSQPILRLHRRVICHMKGNFTGF